MAFSLTLPISLRKAQWKVKIRDRERLEPPHLTIIRGRNVWRISLRDREFMDNTPDPSDVPEDLIDFIDRNWQLLCSEWDKIYPNNPVAGDVE